MFSIPSALVSNTGQRDSVMWTLNPCGEFSIKSARQGFGQYHPQVLWWKLVWFKRHVPWWAITQWIAVWGSLSTKDRLQSWGFVIDNRCVLCDGGSRFCLEILCIELLVNCLLWEMEWTAQNKGAEDLQHSLHKLSSAGMCW